MSKPKIDAGLGSRERTKPLPRPPKKIIRNFNHLIAILDARSLDPALREEIIKIAKRYPEGSLDYLYNNLDITINNCQNIISMKNNPAILPAQNEETITQPETINQQETIKPKPPIKVKIEQRPGLFEDILPDIPTIPDIPNNDVKEQPQEIKPKWTTAPVSQYVKKENPHQYMMEQRKIEADLRKQAQKPEKITLEDWPKSDDPELEEYRQKMRFYILNQEQITKEIEEYRKSIGEKAPKPQDFQP